MDYPQVNPPEISLAVDNPGAKDTAPALSLSLDHIPYRSSMSDETFPFTMMTAITQSYGVDLCPTSRLTLNQISGKISWISGM